MTVLRKPGQVAIHSPLQLGGGLRRDVSGVALQARDDHGIADAVQAVARAFPPEKGRVECHGDGLPQFHVRRGLQGDQVAPGEQFRFAEIRALLVDGVECAQIAA